MNSILISKVGKKPPVGVVQYAYEIIGILPSTESELHLYESSQ